MPPRYYATVACPVCGTRFQTPVEQILDVRVNPEVKNRMLSGAVNVAMCPSCGNGGSLNIPFIYHDPEKEVALLFLPFGVGNDEVERQKLAGQLTRQLMDAMPQEERKGYLFQPETFLTMENIVKRVLELEGVTDEDMERSQKQREFLDKFLAAEEEEWPELVKDNEELLDENFFGLLQYSMQVIAMSGANGGDLSKVEDGYTYLVENTAIGQKLNKRTEVVRMFADDPTQANLLEALIAAPDDETVAVLVQSGLSMMDYSFFQQLVYRMEAAEDSEEKAHLAQLRRKILEIRDEVMEASEDIARDRAQLLEKMLNTDDPLKMARSHLSELDDTFALVMRSELTAARNRGDKESVEALQHIATILNQVTEENMPPEIVLARRLLMAPSEEQMHTILKNNHQLLQPAFFQFLENIEATSREQGEAKTADQLAHIRVLAQQYAPQTEAAPEEEPPAAPQPPTPPETPPEDETRTPSGLIIAKH
ncbi:MAG: CpXC domain-containing protein [Anaerolineae bacterium]